MIFNHSDIFVKFLVNKAHGAWSSTEVIDIFKHRYGNNYDIALANFLMDALQSHVKKTKKNVQDVKYEKEWAKVLK